MIKIARKKLENKLIDASEINEPLVLVSESEVDYITPSGHVYRYCGDNKYLPRANCINNRNGYVYTTIYHKNDRCTRSRRLHRLLAIAYIENPKPDDYDIVGHKDNDKANYDLKNLYWTNTSENTKKAFDDQLAYNDIGINDSQSMPVSVSKDGQVISVYGSICEAGRRIKNLTKGDVHKRLSYEGPDRNGYEFAFITKEDYFSYTGVKNLEFEYIGKRRSDCKRIS